MTIVDVVPYATVMLLTLIFSIIVLVSIVDTRKKLLFGKSLQDILQIAYDEDTKNVQITERQQGAFESAVQQHLNNRKIKDVEFRVFTEIRQGYDVDDKSNPDFAKEMVLVFPRRNKNHDKVLTVHEVLQENLTLRPSIHKTIGSDFIENLSYVTKSLMRRHEDFNNKNLRVQPIGYLIRYTIQLVEKETPNMNPLFEMHSAWRHTDERTEPIAMEEPPSASFSPGARSSLHWDDSTGLVLFNEVRDAALKAAEQREAAARAEQQRLEQERAVQQIKEQRAAAASDDTVPIPETREPLGTPPKSKFPFFKKSKK